jgi:peptidoglycan glycosyltransferase
MDSSICRLARAILVGFAVAAGALLYWQAVRAPELVARDDNPRLVQAELRVRRGRLLDRAGQVLAYSEPNDPSRTDDTMRRRYPCPEAAHVVGYYSPRYGTAGGEAMFDAVLRGELTYIDRLLHRPQVGRDVALSVSLEALRAADQGLGAHRGTVVVLDMTDGDLVTLVSHPSYDPNMLDEEWDRLVADPGAPLLNRASQGIYPVGDLARWVGLAGLRSAGITVPPDPYGASLDALLAPLSRVGYLATAQQLEFDAPVPIDLPGSAGRLPDFDHKGTARDLAVTPLHMARFVAAVAGDGRMPIPTLAYLVPHPTADQVFAKGVSVALRAVMPRFDDVAGWAGVAQPLETGNEPLSWFAGYGPIGEPRFAIVVVVEGADGGAAVTVPVAQQVLRAAG